MPDGPAASARIRTHSSAADMRPDLARHHLESQRQETITGQDGRRLVKRPVARRPATSQVVVIHRRQIVVNQRIRMNHLERASRRQRRLGFAAARFGRHQAQDRTQPLATPQAHCNASPSPAAPDTPTPRPRQPRASSRSRPPRSARAPRPDTRPALTPRLMSWVNSSCFNRFNRFRLLTVHRPEGPGVFETTN